jgi:hypothetical protein
MPVSKPYYNLHQVITGQYTSGNEYVFSDGIDYIGPFHVLPSNQYFTGPRPESNSKEIFEKRQDIALDQLIYNRKTGNSISRYETPVAISRNPTSDEYSIGQMERYFVQKRNSPLNTIIEIDGIQFNKINQQNNPGINGMIWRGLLINWKISKLPMNDAYYANRQIILKEENNFPGLKNFLVNYLEFYK